MVTSEAFNTDIPDICSKLAFASAQLYDTRRGAFDLETSELLVEAAKKIRELRRENSILKDTADRLSWIVYPDRMGQ